jgi:hypothetical protein
MSGQSLYLLACTSHWKPSAGTRFRAIIAAGSKEAEETHTSQERRKRSMPRDQDIWSDCPAFSMASEYALTILNASDARLQGATTHKPIKLEYLGTAPVPATTAQPQASSAAQAQVANKPAGTATVHITSSPSSGEIYVDGKFFGNAPSDFTLSSGEHVVRVALGGKDWTRTLRVTTGEINLNAEIK